MLAKARYQLKYNISHSQYWVTQSMFILLSVLIAMAVFSAPASADLKDGLVAYYPFNGNMLDESGNGYNGTVCPLTAVPPHQLQIALVIPAGLMRSKMIVSVWEHHLSFQNGNQVR